MVEAILPNVAISTRGSIGLDIGQIDVGVVKRKEVTVPVVVKVPLPFSTVPLVIVIVGVALLPPTMVGTPPVTEIAPASIF